MTQTELSFEIPTARSKTPPSGGQSPYASLKASLSMEHAANALQASPRNRRSSPEGPECSGEMAPQNNSNEDESGQTEPGSAVRRPSGHTASSDHTLSGSSTVSSSPLETSPRTATASPLIDSHFDLPEWQKASSPSPPAPKSKGSSSCLSSSSTKTCPEPKRGKLVRQGSAGSSGEGAHRSGDAPAAPRPSRGGNGGGKGPARGGNGSRNGGGGKPTLEQILLNKQLAKLERAEDVLALVEARRGGMQLNGTNLATALHRTAAKAGSKPLAFSSDPRLAWLLAELVALLTAEPAALSPRELSNAFWGAAKLGATSRPLVSAIERACVSLRPSSFNYQDLSNLAWAVATAGVGAPGVMALVVGQCTSRSLEDMSPQVLSNVMWALGKQNHPGVGVLTRLAAHANFLGVAAFKPMEVSSCTWGMAVLGVKDEAWLEAVVAYLLDSELSDFNCQKVSTILWAVARLGYGAEAMDLFFMVEDYVTERTMLGFNPHNVACTVWAFATARCDAVDLFACAEEAVWKSGFKGYDAQCFVDVLWAMAVSAEWTGTDYKDTFALAATDLRKRSLHDFSPKQLSTLAWAFSRLSHFEDQAFFSIENAVLKLVTLEDFTDKGLVFLAAAFQAFRDDKDAAHEKAGGSRVGRRSVSGVGVHARRNQPEHVFSCGERERIRVECSAEANVE
ncbi:hypothetical protein T484DRAFT_3221364 [Baffinella frigidus]|nr:hypothetical protein T484DRAFT_3221364 [Cryptophyta sp. CCMP2293]